MRYALAAALTVAAVVTLAGCTQVPPTLVGRNVATASQIIAHGSLKVYDISPTVVHEPATFSINHEKDFTVIAACKQKGEYAFAVVPSKFYRGKVKAKAERHGYNHYLVECRSR
jgi:hypothetical protein